MDTIDTVVNRKSDPEHDIGMAWAMCQQFVKDDPISPGSANFGGVFSEDYQAAEQHTQHLGDGLDEYRGWVDAQNAFGANNFIVEIKYVGKDEWQRIERPTFVER